jgi:hypothetical protein
MGHPMLGYPVLGQTGLGRLMLGQPMFGGAVLVARSWVCPGVGWPRVRRSVWSGRMEGLVCRIGHSQTSLFQEPERWLNLFFR